MPTAEGGGSRRLVWPGLALVLAGGLGLRLWGVQQGLPYVYNTDENDHFVPHAVRMFEEGTLNPHYFANPPAYTYLLHFVFGLYYGGGHAVVHAYLTDPTSVYTLARVVSALLGTLALWLLYLTGARLFSRGVGLLAAAVLAVAFLPVFYAHLALNDVPTLAPLTLSLLGSAGVLRKGRLRDHLLAGIGIGLACATKYTAGIVVIPYAVALACSWWERRSRTESLAGLALFVLSAAAAFVIANPYALLDYHSFHAELVHQSTLSAESQGKLGAPKDGGLAYYLWSLTWGLGWVPALAALAGAAAIWRSDRRAGLWLVPAPLVFLAFMGTEGRYFGRWLMPILPLLCLLAAFFTVWLATIAWRRLSPSGPGADGPRPPGGPRPGALGGYAVKGAIAGLLVLAVLGQGLVYSVHSGIVLSRTDTRTVTRRWLLANVPAGARIVVEPVSPAQWAHEPPGAPESEHCPPYKDVRWCKWASEYTYLNAAGEVDEAAKRKLGVEDYERTLGPALIGLYERKGYCWVITGSTESGRAEADPSAVPRALAYYRALAEQGTVLYRASPYRAGKGPVAFNFDWSFDYYPLAYERPGPAMTVYRLHGGRCRA
jgi:hypothetical protein